ncbi:4-hydroxyphenylpyruvate dioxygenase [Pantoea cypripedii]
MYTNDSNPLGLAGFAFIEFVGNDETHYEKLFSDLGFTHIATNKDGLIDLFRQGEINFIINRKNTEFPNTFFREHGVGACGVGFYVEDAAQAYENAILSGAKPGKIEYLPGEIVVPSIEGVGGTKIYFVEKRPDTDTFFEINFKKKEGVSKEHVGYGLHTIDHLTNNLYRGRMDYWEKFYGDIFNFRQMRSFDIAGEYSGLHSKALIAPDGKIKIPLNEEADGSKGQIQEFLEQFNGEGIQHIALVTDDIILTVDKLRNAGVPMMTAPPEKYYSLIESRLPDNGRDVTELKARGILIDGSTDRGNRKLLLQIFSQTLVGPLFF